VHGYTVRLYINNVLFKDGDHGNDGGYLVGCGDNDMHAHASLLADPLTCVALTLLDEGFFS